MADLELLAARVISGRYSLRIKTNEKYRSFLFIEPDSATRAESIELYYRARDKAFERGLISIDDSIKDLISRKLWSIGDDKLIVDIHKEIDKLKIQLYKKRNKKGESQVIRGSLSETREKLEFLYTKKNINYNSTAEAISNTKKIRFLIGRRLFKNDGITRVWEGNSFWSDRRTLLEDAIGAYLSAKPSPSELRAIARNEPFRSVWATREATGNIFGRSSADLSDDQKGVLIWAKLYNNAREDPERPEDAVFDDDDMFDAFLALRQEESGKKMDNSDKLTDNEKIKNSDMHFAVMTAEDAPINEFTGEKEGSGYSKEEIMGMNSDTSLGIINSRMAQLQRDGSVAELDFNDRRREKMMARNRAG